MTKLINLLGIERRYPTVSLMGEPLRLRRAEEKNLPHKKIALDLIRELFFLLDHLHITRPFSKWEVRKNIYLRISRRIAECSDTDVSPYHLLMKHSFLLG